MKRPASDIRKDKDQERKKQWIRPVFKDLRLGFEITMYFWNR